MMPIKLGRYALGDEVGRGGMSVVYKGHDPVLDRLVALKVLHPHLTGRQESRQRFSREARAAARLDHPNIVAVHDYADDAEEQAYIVTEFIDGPTLRSFVERTPITRPEVAALMMLPVFEALAHAHAHGIIHRDVKPENIMFRPDGSPVLMDFGIAQIIDMETLTSTGTILGSPAHMAPEIVDGQPVGAPADIFSAGTVLYWLVCGALPFSGPTPAALFKRILDVRFDPVLQRRPHAGRTLARLVEQCLARAPEDRPSGAAVIAKALRSQLDEAGLVDPHSELAEFYADPAVYQDRLGHRIAPKYLAAAQDAWAIRQTPRALDLLDRILAIDEDHPEARALLARIERGQRGTMILKLAVAATLLLGLGGATWWGLSGAPSTLGAIMSQAGDLTPPVASTLSEGPDVGLPPSAARDASVPETEADAAVATVDAAVDAALPAQDAAPADRGLPDAGATVATNPTRRRRRPRRRDAAVEQPSPADAGPPPQEIPVEFRVGRWQGAEIRVDGERVGYGGQLMARQAQKRPLTLPPGRHAVEILVDGCVTFRRQYTMVEGQSRLLVPYQCRYESATLVVTTKDANARLSVLAQSKTGTYRGFTNDRLSIRMNAQQSPTRVSVQRDGRLVGLTEVQLKAGGNHSLTYPFVEVQ